MPAAAAFAPCQITGFFRIHDNAKNPLFVGSTGAGVNLEQGVTTKVSASRASSSKARVSLNGSPLWNPVVSNNVVSRFLRQDGRKWRVRVSHYCDLPVGCGYGTSGSGALSLALSLNQALGEPLTSFEAAAVAHQAEVATKSGLGTVTSVFFGGLLARLGPGSPGLARVKKIPVPSTEKVVSGSLGPMPTRKSLSNVSFRTRVNRCSLGLVQALQRERSEGSFLRLSRRFADCLGSASPRLKTLFGLGDRHRVAFSMMMIGESGFTITSGKRVNQVVRLMESAGFVPRISQIPSEGAHLL